MVDFDLVKGSREIDISIFFFFFFLEEMKYLEYLFFFLVFFPRNKTTRSNNKKFERYFYAFKSLFVFCVILLLFSKANYSSFCLVACTRFFVEMYTFVEYLL